MTRSVRINSLLRRLSLPNRQDHRSPVVDPDHNGVDGNIDTILAAYRHAVQKINRSQRVVEYVSDICGRPAYLAAILGAVALWIAGDSLANHLYGHGFDAPPYSWLQGIVTLAALLTSTVVLIKQVRMSRVDAERAHLALQVNLLAEQKITKVIELLEELRRDLPMVKNREDPDLAAMQQPADPDAMMVTIAEWRSDTDPGLVIPQ